MKKACHISCGEAHTALLTKDGAVYTFGSGQHGQLGHNSFRDELKPRLVAELWGSKVTAVACGKLHTVLLTGSRVYSCGAQGPGAGLEPQDGAAAAVPLLVQLPYELPEGRSIRQVFAGGHCSYAACSLQEREHQSEGTSPPRLSDLLTKWTSDTQSWKKTKREIARTFCSASRLNQSFLEHRHFETSSTRCGLDLSAAHSSFSKLLNKPKVMEERNKTLGSDRLPDSEFNKPVPFHFVIAMVMWKLEPTLRINMGEEPILYSFPFLMDLPTRHQALTLSNKYLMEKSSLEWTWEEECLEMLFTDLFIKQSFTLRLRRERVLEDTFTQLSLTESTDLRKHLQVYFNDVDIEDNLNQKDFFHLLFHELVSAESGMFMFNDSATLAWFSSTATPPLEHYFLFGELCGLALYHQHVLFLPFPLALFKKLLQVAPSLDDLCQLSPCTGQSLRCLLEEYSDDVIQNLDMGFTIYWDQMEVALDPHSPDRPVTAHNKEEFVAAFIKHVFTSSVHNQFEEFRRGFYRTLDPHMVELFSPEELRDLMVGRECTDWTKLKQSAVYEGVYGKDREHHPTIQMFWEVFDELTEEERKALLWFITGFERLPILHVDLKIKFQGLSQREEGLSEDQYFPQSHTCFSGLELPQYSCKELMKSRLCEALAQVHHRLDPTVKDITAPDLFLYD